MLMRLMLSQRRRNSRRRKSRLVVTAAGDMCPSVQTRQGFGPRLVWKMGGECPESPGHRDNSGSQPHRTKSTNTESRMRNTMHGGARTDRSWRAPGAGRFEIGCGLDCAIAACALRPGGRHESTGDKPPGGTSSLAAHPDPDGDQFQAQPGFARACQKGSAGTRLCLSRRAYRTAQSQVARGSAQAGVSSGSPPTQESGVALARSGRLQGRQR